MNNSKVITGKPLKDMLLGAYHSFEKNIEANNDLNVANKTTIIEINNRLEKNKFSKKLSNTLFNDNIMLKTYPNLKVQEINGSIVYFKDLLPNIKPYYIRFQDKDFYK